MLQQTTMQETRVHYKRYVHHAHAVGVTWALLTCCFLIINIIVFAEPQWIGDTDSSPGTGWVGLFQICELVNSASVQVCSGYFQDFSSILTNAMKASTFFIGVSVLLIFLCVLCFLLFLFFQEIYVYIVCGVIQVISTIFMFLGCVIYPNGWDNIMIKRICGDTMSPYHLGLCQMRWSYILAIVGVFDILILAILAFVLAFRQADKWTKYDQLRDGKGNPNAGYVVDVASSKPGSVIVPHQGTSRSGASGAYGGAASGAYGGAASGASGAYGGGASGTYGGRGGTYAPDQYIVNDGPGGGGGGSEFSSRRRARASQSSEAHLVDGGDEGASYRGGGRLRDDRQGSF